MQPVNLPLSPQVYYPSSNLLPFYISRFNDYARIIQWLIFLLAADAQFPAGASAGTWTCYLDKPTNWLWQPPSVSCSSLLLYIASGIRALQIGISGVGLSNWLMYLKWTRTREAPLWRLHISGPSKGTHRMLDLTETRSKLTAGCRHWHGSSAGSLMLWYPLQIGVCKYSTS